jgi:DnaJ-class molecular chaperone
MSTHELKTWPEFFEPLSNGNKTFELRYNDRAYSVGDELCLREFDPCRTCGGKGKVAGARAFYSASVPCPDCAGTGGRYTGRFARRFVTYTLKNHPALLREYVVLGLRA